MKEREFNTEQFKKVLQDKGLKRSFIASKVGVTAQTLGLIISGKRKPSKPLIKMLAIILGESEEVLFK